MPVRWSTGSIVVCQNTAISKLVYDYISGFYRKLEDDPTLSQLEHGLRRGFGLAPEKRQPMLEAITAQEDAS